MREGTGSRPNTTLRFIAYVLAATLACAAITVAFAALSSWVQAAVAQNPQLAEDVAPVLRKRFAFDWIFVVMAIVAAPLIETVLVAVTASVSASRGWPARTTVLVAGAIFGVLHAANGLLAIVPAALVFMVLTASYIHWRKVSLQLALMAAAIPHALVNAGVVAVKASIS